jgi:hypothetical protein
VIEGLQLEMTAEELVARLSERIAWHEDEARECDAQLASRSAARKSDEAAGEDEEADTAPVLCPPRHVIRMDRDDHRERAAFLTLLRDHLVPGEIYRLAEEDLRLADFVPSFIFASA